MKQTERILKYIDDFGSITQAQAFMDLGVMRLASRINDLKKAGYAIGDEYVSSKNRYGETVYYKKYYLKEVQ